MTVIAAGIVGACTLPVLISMALYMLFDFPQATVMFFLTVVIPFLMFLFARKVVSFDLVHSAHETRDYFCRQSIQFV